MRDLTIDNNIVNCVFHLTAISERDLRMGEWNNRRQWDMEVGRRRHKF
jgi:hypothetical protein